MKKLFLLALPYIFSLIWSCSLNCDNDKPYFLFGNLNISNYNYDQSSATLIGNTDSVDWPQYQVLLEFEITEFVAQNWSMITSVYADECLDGGPIGSKYGLSDIYLISDQDYNTQISSNDTLREELEFAFGLENPQNYTEYESFMQQNNDHLSKNTIALRLTTGPDQSASYSFDCVVELDNKDVYRINTGSILLRK